MLENKTKLHMQLEERDLAHQQAQGLIKKLNSEIEILQRKINQQRFLAPYLTKSIEQREAQKNNINGQNGDGYSASKTTKTLTHAQSNSPNKLIQISRQSQVASSIYPSRSAELISNLQ